MSPGSTPPPARPETRQAPVLSPNRPLLLSNEPVHPDIENEILSWNFPIWEV